VAPWRLLEWPHLWGDQDPDMDSLLVGFSPGTKIIGWDSVPAADRPPVVWLIHLCFDAMVGIGFLLLLAGLWAAYSWWRQSWQWSAAG